MERPASLLLTQEAVPPLRRSRPRGSCGAPALRVRRPADHFARPHHQPRSRDRGSETRTPSAMEPAAILTLILIGGFVWGGLILLLAAAIRKEQGK